MTELIEAVDKDAELASTIGETTSVAWIAPAVLSYQQWEAIGRTMQQVNRSLNWWLGDWLNVGEARYGETYAQAVEVTDSSVDTLRKYKGVAARVAIGDRNEHVSWSHHALVAYLDAAEHKPLLELAERYELSTRTFERVVKLSSGDRAALVEAAIADGLQTRDFHALLERLSAPVESTPPAPAAPSSAQRLTRLAGLRSAEVPPKFGEEEEAPAQAVVEAESTPLEVVASPSLFDLGPDPFAEAPGAEEAEAPNTNDALAEIWENLGVPLASISYDEVSWGEVSVKAEIDEDGNPVLAWTIDL